MGDIAAVDAILRKGTACESGYFFASDRHLNLVRELGLPEFAVHNTYAGLLKGRYPEGFSAADFVSSV